MEPYGCCRWCFSCFVSPDFRGFRLRLPNHISTRITTRNANSNSELLFIAWFLSASQHVFKITCGCSGAADTFCQWHQSLWLCPSYIILKFFQMTFIWYVYIYIITSYISKLRYVCKFPKCWHLYFMIRRHPEMCSSKSIFFSFCLFAAPPICTIVLLPW